MLETIGAIVGAAFIFAKVVGLIKSVLFVEQAVAPIVKQKLVNERADFIRAHYFEEHKDSIRNCQFAQCAAF